MKQEPHVREALAAFVFGALEADEAARVESHLARCAECRAEQRRLAELPRLLDVVAPARDLPSAPAPARLEEAVVAAYATARGNRPRGRIAWNRRHAGLAGALAGAAATVALLAVGGVFRTGSSTERVQLTAPPGMAASGRASLRPARAGTRVTLRVDGLAPTRGRQVYEVWFVHGDGRVSAGTFALPRGGGAQVELTTAARPGGYDRIGVTLEPDGLDPRRNGPNVLAGPLT